MKPYLLVAGDFRRTGGMDMPNLALATGLAQRGHEVHLVAHAADSDLLRRPTVRFHRVPRPAGSYLLAEPLLDWVGRWWASRIGSRSGHVVVNGGNCQWGDVNWVHYVHAAWAPLIRCGALLRRKARLGHLVACQNERSALARARLVVTNSERTGRDVETRCNVSRVRRHTIYYGVDAVQFHPPTSEERAAARAVLGWREDSRIVVFVGALTDRRKGFDTVFAAWYGLCSDRLWDADLIVVGQGAELVRWMARAEEFGMRNRIQFLGFRNDVSTILAASDVLIAPTRYEAYGSGVHEALCCGLPAFVTRTAGVAERYPADLQDLLIQDPEDWRTLADRLRTWRKDAKGYQERVSDFSKTLRAHTWDQMVVQMLALIEEVA